MFDMWRGMVTSGGVITASPGSAAILSSGWTAGNEYEVVFDEDRQEGEIVPVVQAKMLSTDTVKIRTLAPQTYTTTVMGANKIGLRMRFEDAATGNLVKPSSFALLVQVPS